MMETRPGRNKTDRERSHDVDATATFRFWVLFRILRGERVYRLWFKNARDRAEFIKTHGIECVGLGDQETSSPA